MSSIASRTFRSERKTEETEIWVALQLKAPPETEETSPSTMT